MTQPHMLQAVLYRGTGTTCSMPRLATTNKVAMALRACFEESILREHGLPPSDHWHKVTVSILLVDLPGNGHCMPLALLCEACQLASPAC